MSLLEENEMREKREVMAATNSQFTSASGQFYVAHQLTARGIHASITVGNAPHVDIIAASADGSGAISIQVKTSRNAYRRNRYGREGHEWDVGAASVGTSHESLWYAFVDLRSSETGIDPEVFIVPSLWVGDFVKPNFSRKMYFLPSTADPLSRERWDLIESYLAGDEETRGFANTWPEDKLVRWGE